MCQTQGARGSAGFSLVELMMAMTIGAVLLTIAAPALSGMLRNGRVLTASNALLGTVHRLQVEAITRGVRTTACTSLDGLDCGSAADWHDGWIVFRDEDADGVRDEHEMLLLAHGPMGGNISATGNAPVRRYLSYIPAGRSATLGGGLQMGTITVCEDGVARQIVISASGRPRSLSADC